MSLTSSIRGSWSPYPSQSSKSHSQLPSTLRTGVLRTSKTSSSSSQTVTSDERQDNRETRNRSSLLRDVVDNTVMNLYSRFTSVVSYLYGGKATQADKPLLSMFDPSLVPHKVGQTPYRVKQRQIDWAAETSQHLGTIGDALKKLPLIAPHSNVHVYVSDSDSDGSEDDAVPLSDTAHPSRKRQLEFSRDAKIIRNNDKLKSRNDELLLTEQTLQKAAGFSENTSGTNDSKTSQGGIPPQILDYRPRKNITPLKSTRSGWRGYGSKVTSQKSLTAALKRIDESRQSERSLSILTPEQANEFSNRKKIVPKSPSGSARLTPAKNRNTSFGIGPKEAFRLNFRKDQQKDQQAITFLSAKMGLDLKELRKALNAGRLPKLDDTKMYTSEQIDFASAVLGDAGFLRRNEIYPDPKFEPLYGVRRSEREVALKTLPAFIIEDVHDEPQPVRKVREFTPAEQKKMCREKSYGPLEAEWSQQTIYDLEFADPTEDTLEDDREITGERWEISRRDPRLRHILPGIMLQDDTIRTDQDLLNSRLSFKRTLSRRDVFWSRLISGVEAHNRGLAKLYRKMDLMRKRREMSWDDYRRVQLVLREDHNAALAAQSSVQESAQAGAHQQALDLAREVTKNPDTPASKYIPRPATVKSVKTARFRGDNSLTDVKFVDTWIKKSDESDFEESEGGSSKRSGEELEHSSKRQRINPVPPKGILKHPAPADGENGNPAKKAKTGKSELTRYQKSCLEFPRESRAKAFSLWDKDLEDKGMFYDDDIENGLAPKGRGRWEEDVAKGAVPHVIIVTQSDGTAKFYHVWEAEGILRPTSWKPANWGEAAKPATASPAAVSPGTPKPLNKVQREATKAPAKEPAPEAQDAEPTVRPADDVTTTQSEPFRNIFQSDSEAETAKPTNQQDKGITNPVTPQADISPGKAEALEVETLNGLASSHQDLPKFYTKLKLMQAQKRRLATIKSSFSTPRQQV